MQRNRVGAAILATSCALLVGGTTMSPAHAGILLDRWASPTGTESDTCVQADPCDIVTAINDAPANSTVHLLAGQYGSSGTPISTTLEPPHQPTTIKGADPKHPPVIFDSGVNDDSALLTYGATVSDLTLISTATTTGLYLLDGSTAERVAVYASLSLYGACSVYDSTLSDSLCVQTSDNQSAIGLGISGTGTTTSTFENVTAVATGAHSEGLSSSASGGVAFNLDITNSIIEGRQHDLDINASAGSTSTVTTSHSLYRPSTDLTNGATIVGSPSNITTKAMFINPTMGDYREKKTSPSIDHGLQAIPGHTDLAGNPRTLGKGTDIGAYEFLPRPVVGHLKVVKVKHHVGTFTVKVNAEGLHTNIRLIARHKLHKVKSALTDIGHGRKAKHLKLHFKLDPGTKYHVRARATNEAGVTQSNNKYVQT